MLILKFFSNQISNQIQEFFKSNVNFKINELEEIHLRTNNPVILKFNSCEKIIDYIVKIEDILESLEHICNSSIYAYQNQICNGFITVEGGHRVGITGDVVIQDNKIINIKYISSINFRFAKEIIGCSNSIINDVFDKENYVYNTLIISSPGAGKTTILRDLVRNLSNLGLTIGLVDERGEIAAMYKGISQNDLGIRTDILTNIPKSIGLKMLIRSMNPKIIVADEIGSNEDVEAINYAVCCGINGIFTVHGNTLQDLKLNPSICKLIELNIFEKLIFLENGKEKGKISKKYKLDKNLKEYVRI